MIIIGRGKTTSRMLFDDAKQFFKKYPNDVTRKAFTRNYRKFITFCREQYKCNSKEECERHIADYSAYLQTKDLSPSTIHTYLSPVCIYHEHNLREYEKPKRVTAEFTRNRSFNGKAKRSDNDLSNKKYERTVSFQLSVGIRRNELLHLKGRDLVRDENACLFILVRNGKGGKRHLQRILPQHQSFVSSFFEGKGPDEPVFDNLEFKNKIPYHYLRAKLAQEAYSYYERICQTPEGRKQLEEELRKRWQYNINKKTGRPKRFDEHLIQGTYFLRGENKKFAIKHGLPIKYDRLALCCVSCLHLAHWRLNVVQNYLLTI